MADNVLAKTVVQMVATGVDKVQSAVSAVGAAAIATGQRIQQMTGSLARVGVAAGAAGGSLLAIFGTRAMAGTVEAEKFGMAMERLFRVTGDALAPYVRFATDAIIKLTHAFYTLSPQTKDLISQVALIATGIGVLSGAFLTVSGVASMLAPALMGIFAGPIPKLGIITGLLSLFKIKLISLTPIVQSVIGGMQKLSVMAISATASLTKMGIVLVKNAVVGLVNFKTMILQAVVSLIRFSAAGIASAIASMASLSVSMISMASGMVSSVIPAIVSTSQSMLAMAGSFAGTAVNAIRQATFTLTVMGLYLSGNMVAAIQTATASMLAFATNAMASLINSLRAATVSVITFGASMIASVVSSVQTTIVSLTAMTVAISGNLIPSLRAGIAALATFSLQALRAMAAMAVSAAQSLVPLIANLSATTVAAGRFAVAMIASAVVGIKSAIASAASMSVTFGGQVVESVRAATVSVLRFSAALAVQTVSALQSAAVGLIAMVNPAKIAGMAMSALGGIVTMTSAIITGSLTVLGGVFSLLSAAILPVIGLFIGFVAAEKGVFAPGIDMGERFVRVIETLLDIWEGMKSAFSIAGQMLYDTFGPALDWLSNAFFSVVNEILKFFGVELGGASNDGAQDMAKGMNEGTNNVAKSGLSMVESMVKFFGMVRKAWKATVDFIQNTWNAAVNSIADAMAQAGEAMGIVPKGTANALKEDNARETERNMKKQKDEMAQIEKQNQSMMEDLKKRLEENKGKARNMAKPILDMFNAAKGGGFHMKAEVQFEGLQSTYDRLQKAMANISGKGVTIEEQQLRTMQDVYNETVKMNANLSAVRQAVPAVE